MTATIKVELAPGALALTQAFRNFPDALRQSIKRGLTDALQEVAVRVRSHRLTGKGPFPVEEHRLGIVTGLLYGTTDATAAQVIAEGDFATITGSIGTPVPYATVHEYGFSGQQNVRAHLRESVRGKVYSVREHTRQMNIPARAPFHTGIGENLGYIVETIENAIEDAASKLPST